MATTKPIISTSFNYETLEETLDIKVQGARLEIGIPKEIAFQENRISLTPDAVGVLVNNGHKVTVEHNAGNGSHFTDQEYSEAGANIVYSREEIFKAPTLIKSAPIVAEDLPLLQLNQTIVYDPETGTFVFRDIMGKDTYFRAPQAMTLEEYLAYEEKKSFNWLIKLLLKPSKHLL